ncbi:MAG: protoporphyrin IX magnesium chelatase [Bacteroidetes bacterium]|nr:MAG: protoporphyrin IX magnesium chelatase [Bacteroidota bacterium]PIE88340.1 MAG: protoporphyrin IX magnesium chelatase [Bacteroidota bacterium]
MRKKIVVGLTLFVVVVFVGFYYHKHYAPTRVGLINFPDFMYAKIVTANEEKAVKIDKLYPRSLPSLRKYDALFVFGMGLELPEDQKEKIVRAGEKGADIFMYAATNPALQLTNIAGHQLDNISGYLENGGRFNYRNMFKYIRYELDGKRGSADSVSPPRKINSDVLFYLGEDAIFNTVEEFQQWALKTGVHQKKNRRVLLFTSVPGPFNANREHIDSLIVELESRNLNVYPVAGWQSRLRQMQTIQPDLIVYLPHGRLDMSGDTKAVIDWLEEQDVPVLCPVSVFSEYEKWLKDKQGMFGGLLSQSVTMPEFDGGIVPYAVFAQYKTEQGLLVFQAVPERLEKFGEIVSNYLNLKELHNHDKKVAIVYFKGPGKNALEASNMEVLPSLYNLLKRMKREGYNVEGLPETYEAFEEVVMRMGPVLGPYAEGAFDTFLKEGSPELIEAVTYEQWCEDLLPSSMYEEVVNRYGKAPGSFMSVYKDSTEYLAVARVAFGNVVLLPQPLPGIGENQFALVHGAKTAPPHAYIAPYFWIQQGFQADAIFHFGTHGSLEFTPGKQIALSQYDWTDPLIGTTPHFYIYTISNVGEGMIAKRRSYAVTQTYLTPPFIEAQAFSNREIMHTKLHKYEQAKGAVKNEYALSIKAMAVKAKIHLDLGLDSILDQPYSEADMMKLANYLEEIEHEKVTGGLYTMGVPYPKDKLEETVQLMLVDAIAYNLAELDVLKKKIDRERIEDKKFFNDRYTHPSERYLGEVLRTKNPLAVFQRIVSSEDRARAQRWEDQKKDFMAMPMATMGMMGAKASHEEHTGLSREDSLKLRGLIIRCLPDEEKKSFLMTLESDKSYEKAIALLDKEKFRKVKNLAKVVPPMAKALEVATDSIVFSIIEMVEDTSMRNLALHYLHDEGLMKDVEAEERRQEEAIRLQALLYFEEEVADFSVEECLLLSLEDLRGKNTALNYLEKHKDELHAILGKIASPSKEEQALVAFMDTQLAPLMEAAGREIARLETLEEDFSRAVQMVKHALEDVLKKQKALRESPEEEFVAILNSLEGGYTSPSPGGDPIANPASLPTGRNLYSIDAEQTPTPEAWRVGKKLGESLLEDYRSKHDGQYPEKISFTLWSSSFIESEGATIAQILYLLGVEPIWNAFGRVYDVRMIPLEELKRPRIDVLVQTSGQLRDLAASRLFLINRAIQKVAMEGGDEENFVKKGVRDAEQQLVDAGFSPKDARKLSSQRIFGGVNGNYGTGIMGMVENSGRWDSSRMVAKTYIQNMGARYSDAEDWGEYEDGVFRAALLNTEAVVQPRQSNTWGALSLDHVYEFMGGMNLAVKEVTGNDAESYFNDFRNASHARVQGLKEAVWVETRTTLLNPRYIKEYMKGGASSAETFAETFRNTFGWNVMKPSVIEDRLWDDLYDTYVEDKQQLGVQDFFKRENPYAMQEMSAVMLETARKGMWKASQEQIAKLATLHAELVKEHEAGCSGFVCDNAKLKSYIQQKLTPELQKAYETEIASVREKKSVSDKESVVLEKENRADEQPERSVKKRSNALIPALVVVGILLLLVFYIRRRNRG